MIQALKKYGPVFTGPTLIAFIIAFLLPFFVGLYLSFTQFTT
ncbi:MAG: sugar ABC transporter permease, partial [Ancrocorticia sp.]|nr:sugar ABC transporter permease [Ancrocorticia sp.]